MDFEVVYAIGIGTGTIISSLCWLIYAFKHNLY